MLQCNRRLKFDGYSLKIDRLIFVCVWLVMLMVVIKNANASTLNLGLSQSYENSNNILLVEDTNNNEIYEDTLQTTSLSFQYEHSSREIESLVNGVVSYIDYKNDWLDDRSVGRLNSLLKWNIKPSQHSWLLSYDIRQTRVDPLGRLSPINTQNIDILTTGPELSFKYGHTIFGLSVMHNSINYDEVDLGSDTLNLSLNVSRKIKSYLNLSFSATERDVDYDAIGADGYKQKDYFLNLNYSNTAETIVFRSGVSAYEYSTGGNNRANVNGVTYSRKITDRSTLVVTYDEKLVDRGTSTNIGSSVIDSVFVEHVSGLQYEKVTGKYAIKLAYNRILNESLESNAEESSSDSQIQLSREIATNSSIFVSYLDNKSDVLNILGAYEDKRYEREISYVKTQNKNISYSFHIKDVVVKSSDFLRQYSEKRIGMTLSIKR